MKKIFNYLLIVTLLIGTAVSFSSCKDDDDDYKIAGVWKWTDAGGDYAVITLNEDGSCIYFDYDTEYGSDTEYGRYSYGSGSNYITFYIGDESENWTISWVDKNHIVMDGDHWYRQ